MIRSRSRREKMSKLRSPRLVCSTTTGTSAASGSIIENSSFIIEAPCREPAGWPLRRPTSSPIGTVSRGQKEGAGSPASTGSFDFESVAFARIGREERLELVFDALISIGVGGGSLFSGEFGQFGAALAFHLDHYDRKGH